jgi:hypothetical protein
MVLFWESETLGSEDYLKEVVTRGLTLGAISVSYSSLLYYLLGKN